jgi:protein-disulfide isomerase
MCFTAACGGESKQNEAGSKKVEEKAAGTEKAGDEKAGDEKAGDEKAAMSSTGDACKDYAAAVCKEVGGATSPTCKSFEAVTDLMPPEACEAGMKNVAFSAAQFKKLGSKCDELIDKLCKGVGEDTQTCAMVRTKTKQFPPEQCKMMLPDADKIIVELKQQEEANKPLGAEQMASISKGNDSAAFGSKDSKVTVVEFSDFECPYCSKAATATNDIKKKYGEKVRVIFRHFPLSFHKNAHLAHQASAAAGEQGKFWEYHDKLFANQRALTRPDLEKYATELSLNMAKFKDALDKNTYAASVDADIELGKKVFVQGTPSMFINGERVTNPTDIGAISVLIDKHLK